MNKSSIVSKKSAILLTALLATTVLATSCREQGKPATISVTVPSPDTIQAAVTLTARYGLGLSGNFPVTVRGVNYGSVFLTPESPASGLGFGFTLNTGVFLRDTWVNYEEVAALPTGDAFPAWMAGPVVELEIPPMNSRIMDWRLYFGARGQYYVGAVALIHAINNKFPAIRLEYSFYDEQGRAVIGLVFFGPKLNGDGSVAVPGGIYVGTNISPFLPAGAVNPEAAMANAAKALQGVDVQALASAAVSGRPVRINGKSVVADINITGRDAKHYRSRNAVQGLVDSYTAASRR